MNAFVQRTMIGAVGIEFEALYEKDNPSNYN
jgi:hypothetical protein